MTSRIPRVTRTEAVVLRHRRLGDADRIVTLVTLARGKIVPGNEGLAMPMEGAQVIYAGNTTDTATTMSVLRELSPHLVRIERTLEDLERPFTARKVRGVRDRVQHLATPS